MPEIVSYTPAWLSRPSDGASFFDIGTEKLPSPNGNRRIIAHRGSEIFLAVGNEIRWADLKLIEAKHVDASVGAGKGWRAVKAPGSLPIHQLSISPDGSLLAVITEHTCHICILPDSSFLRSGDDSILRFKSYQLGPTAHVVEQSPLASCIWHPLSLPGLQVLVTITLDASVRLWELDINNRCSFDQPSLAVSLVKLVSAKSILGDLSPSKFGSNRGFSPDDVEMEVAAACFGGEGSEDEYGWASMTLWIAMSEGDIYALCPLLPSRYSLSSSTLPALSTSVIAEAQIIMADPQASDLERERVHAQSEWLASLDGQDPVSFGDDVNVYQYSRPERPGPIAKLQGPFQLDCDLDGQTITDILAVPPLVDDSQLYDEDGNRDLVPPQGLGLSVLCVATSTGRIHICLPSENVQAQWLPSKQTRAFTMDDDFDFTELLLFQTVLLPSGSGSSSPSFTTSPVDLHEIFVTTDHGVFSLDLKPWVSQLDDELTSEGLSGTSLRLNVLLKSFPTTVDRIIDASSTNALRVNSSAIAMYDATSDLTLLTASSDGPRMATLSVAYDAEDPYKPEHLSLPAPELRESYQVSPVFYARSEFERTMATKRANPIFKAESAGPLLGKPGTLQVFTDAHRILSSETNRLNSAAADLFRRCERMCFELQEQIRKIEDLSLKVEMLTGDQPGEEAEEMEDHSVDAKIDQRLMKIQSNTSNINERLEQLQRKMLKLGGEVLSIKEQAFVEEVQQLHNLTDDQNNAAPVDSMTIVSLPDHEEDTQPLTSSTGSLVSRLRSAMDAGQSMIAQVSDVLKQQQQSGLKRAVASSNEYKKHRLESVKEMLERESALIEAVSDRLSRLNGGLS